LRETPAAERCDLREIYELLRSRRRAGGQNAYALLVTRGLAEWIRRAVDLFPAAKSIKPGGPADPGVEPARREELPPGVLPDLVPILAGLFLDSMKGEAR
jgi:hypothetical protein